MASVAFVAPILPGKEEVHKRFIAEFTGPRRNEYQESRRRLGVTREETWHQQTPDGTVAIVFIEAEDPGQAMQGMGSSNAPFDQWFREQVKEIHGFDLAEASPLPPPEHILKNHVM